MSKMPHPRLLCILALFIGSMAPAHAELMFDFEFENEANGGGTVTGTISGLADDSTGQADSVEITGNTQGAFGVGVDFAPFAFNNSFTVSSGTLTEFAFLSFGTAVAPPATASLSFQLSALTGLTSAGLSASPAQVLAIVNSDFTVTPSPSPVSEPAVLPLLAAGMIAMGFMRRRRQEIS